MNPPSACETDIRCPIGARTSNQVLGTPALTTSDGVAYRAHHATRGERTVNKKGLVTEVSTRTSLPPTLVAEVVDAVFATIARSVVTGEKVVLAGFGTFLRQS